MKIESRVLLGEETATNSVTRRRVGRWDSVDRTEGSEGEGYDVPLENLYDYEYFDESPPAEDQIDYISSTGPSDPGGAENRSDSDRDSEGTANGVSTESSSTDLVIPPSILRDLITGLSTEPEHRGRRNKRAVRKRDKEYRLLTLDQIAELPFINEEKLSTLLAAESSIPEPESDETTPTNSHPSDRNKDLISLLTNVFSSPYALSKSFLIQKANTSMDISTNNTNAKHKITPEIAVDVVSVCKSYALLESLGDEQIEKCLSNSIHKMGKELYRINRELSRSSRGSMSLPFHLLNVYVIIMECPFLATPRFIHHGFPYLCQAIATLGSRDQEDLVVWFSKYSKENLLRIVQGFQQLITYRILELDSDEYFEVQSDDVIPVAVKSLRLFYLASLLYSKNHGFIRPYNKSRVAIDDKFLLSSRFNDPIIEKFGIYPNAITKPAAAFEDFYNESLNNIIDIQIDIENALASTRKFSFLKYSFVLNAATKVLKLFFESKVQMIEERRRTVFNLILSGGGGDDHPFLNLQVNRNSLLLDTLGNIEAVADIRPEMFKKQLRINFEGEEGLDEGGPQKEFFQLLIEQLFNPDFGMFYVMDNGTDYWFNMFSFENEASFRLIGILLGLAIYNSIILDVHFPITVYRKLLNCTPTYDDLHDSHPQMARSFADILSYKGEDFEDTYMLTFMITYTGPFGDSIEHNLKEDGDNIPVTKDNRKEYVDMYTDWLLNSSIELQFAAFKQGFDIVMKSNYLDDMFTAEEVELLVCGSQDFDFKELEKTTSYDGFTPSHKLMIYFWDVVNNFPEETKRKLLQFITGTDRVPVGGLSKIKMVIVKNGPDSDRLPSAHTCFNALLLPNYPSKEKLTERLMKALKFGKGFGMI
ncbi:Ubiquitin-protein ligase E3A-like [Oopsacas minuta]|uniref:HECT-type E3 ubiquitin transferase n=1 Tax=Oopsacas minuta TaxID=111878 RepID=A0AAV7JF45_9METZ|nr:Ubiquitin-protein ligase E3A-like [Oopsacas minuta]